MLAAIRYSQVEKLDRDSNLPMFSKARTKALLSQLQRIILIMNYCHRDADDPPLIALDQNAKRLGVPFFSPLDELGFVPVLADWLVQ